MSRSAPVTRPAPPLRRDFEFRSKHPRHHHHHHRHDRAIIVYDRPFFASPWYPYGPYSSSYFYGFDRPWHYAPESIDTPFYCWLDGTGFEDSTSFAEHLHDAHGLPLETALASTESVDGRLIYFGR